MTEQQMLSVVILAAGKGTRMRNDLPKVLHPLAGRSLITHALGVAQSLEAFTVVVLAPGMDPVATEIRQFDPTAQIAIQNPPLGTGHAVVAAVPLLPGNGTVIVLFGDTPLIQTNTLEALVAHRQDRDAAVAVVGMRPQNPTGYGRLDVNTNGELSAIIEDRHASAELKSKALCNSGVMAIDAAMLADLVKAIPVNASNGEYYLTEIVHLARERGRHCVAIEAGAEEGLGINSQAQLAEAEAVLQQRLRAALLAKGVIMQAPETVFLSADTEIGAGTRLEPHVVFGPGVTVDSDVTIRSFSHIEGAHIHTGAQIGPFARLRPGTDIGERARIGNFVEAKNARLRAGAKANHLTYLGDCDIGERSNIGAGTITCNYDGFAKHRTELGSDVFIGSNSALVAPLQVGDGSTIGAGSVITRNVPSDTVAIGRGKQNHAKGRASKLRERLRNQSKADVKR